jgi:hypothetical protein
MIFMTVLDDILNSYPDLFDKREHSNHYKYHKALAALEEEYLRDKLLVELGQNIKRPIRIWRKQIQPHHYTIEYDVNLENIRRVKLYKDGSTPELLDNTIINASMVDVIFTAAEGLEAGFEIPPGTKVRSQTDPSIVFESINPIPYYIPGPPVTVPMSCMGDQYVPVGDLTELITPVEGIISVINESPSQRGTDEGVNSYSSSYTGYSADNIPVTKYYVEVTNNDGKIFQKGIPENGASEGDIYDHDQALDVWGNTLQIPRQKFKENIPTEDYPYTEPHFFTDLTECDVEYEKRIIESMENYMKYPLTIAEIKRVLRVLAIVTGRWRIVDAGGHVKDGEYNAAVHEFSASLDDIPRNIDFSSAGDIQGIINRTMPAGKKGYFVLSQEEALGSDGFTLEDSIGEIVWIPEPEAFSLDDYLVASVESQIAETLELLDTVQLLGLMQPTELLELQDQIAFTGIGNIRNENLGLNDQVTLKGLLQKGESIGLSEEINWTEIARVLYHDTNTDFAADTLTGCSIQGTGSAAYVKLDPLNTNQSDNPTGQSQSGEGFNWTNPGNVVDDDISTFGSTERPDPVNGNTGAKGSTTQTNVDNGMPGTCDWGFDVTSPPISAVEVSDGSGVIGNTTPSNRKTNLLWANGFGFNIPTDATITGVRVRVKKMVAGTVSNRDDKIRLVYGGSERGNNKATDEKWNNGSYTTVTYGGSDDDWAASLTPAIVNSSSFGVAISAYNGSSYGLSFYVDFVDITVYYVIPPAYDFPKLLNLSGLSFNIPSGSQVMGVMARIWSVCASEGRQLEVKVTAGGVTKSKTLTIPTTSSNLDFGGGTDLWGGLPSTPSSYNTVTMTLGVKTRFRTFISMVTLYVYYKLQDGTLQTATINAPPDGYAWGWFEADQNVPAQCGANAVLYDILRASDNSVLLGDRTAPVNISNLAYTDLKVKAKLHTDNVAYYPGIDSLKVTALKNRSY